MKKIILLIVISVFSISCSENKIKLSTEDLNNCAKWNWIGVNVKCCGLRFESA